jgi:hypothetical protein
MSPTVISQRGGPGSAGWYEIENLSALNLPSHLAPLDCGSGETALYVIILVNAEA